MKATFTIPIRTKTGLNSREHHFARAKRVKTERNAAKLATRTNRALREFSASLLFGMPCWLVTLARISPATRLPDDDGVVGGLKGIRDGIADALGVDDGDWERIRFRYLPPERGPWGVRVEIENCAKFEDGPVSVERVTG